MDNEYSQKEENTFRQDLFRRMDNQDTILKDISTKVGIQNGRVRTLEDWSANSQKIIENTTKIASDTLTDYKTDKTKVWAIVGVIIFLGGTIITLSIMAIDAKIEKGIAQALKDNVSKVKYNE